MATSLLIAATLSHMSPTAVAALLILATLLSAGVGAFVAFWLEARSRARLRMRAKLEGLSSWALWLSIFANKQSASPEHWLTWTFRDATTMQELARGLIDSLTGLTLEGGGNSHITLKTNELYQVFGECASLWYRDWRYVLWSFLPLAVDDDYRIEMVAHAKDVESVQLELQQMILLESRTLSHPWKARAWRLRRKMTSVIAHFSHPKRQSAREG